MRILCREYSIMMKSAEIIRTIAAVRPKMKIRTRVSDGEFSSEILFAYAADSGIVCLLASRLCMSSSETNSYRISAPGPESSPG
jgi:hypothetical protein